VIRIGQFYAAIPPAPGAEASADRRDACVVEHGRSSDSIQPDFRTPLKRASLETRRERIMDHHHCNPRVIE
jgi:hypothetical protein